MNAMKYSAGFATKENLDRYENLVNAIVLQAAIDYKRALLHLKWNPENRNWKSEKKKIIEFFKSDWYRVLTEVEPGLILEEMKRQAEKEWPAFRERMIELGKQKSVRKKKKEG